VLFGSNCKSYTVCTQSDIHHNTETLVGQNKFKKGGQYWTSRAKENFERGILGTRVIGSSVLEQRLATWQTIRNSKDGDDKKNFLFSAPVQTVCETHQDIVQWVSGPWVKMARAFKYTPTPFQSKD
jgi:hypothetical protein